VVDVIKLIKYIHSLQGRWSLKTMVGGRVGLSDYPSCNLSVLQLVLPQHFVGSLLFQVPVANVVIVELSL
jgi:hypothetical protein